MTIGQKIATILFWLALISVYATAQTNSTKYTGILQIDTLLESSNNCRIKLLDYTCAIDKAKAAIKSSETFSNVLGQAYSNQLLAYALRDKADYDGAINALQKSIQLLQADDKKIDNAKSHETLINCYTALSEIYLKSSSFDEAQKNAFNALNVSEKYNINKGQSWLALAILFDNQHQLEEAIKYAQKAKKQFENENKPNELARTFAYLANYAYQQEKLDSSIYYYNKSLENYIKAGSKYGERICLYNIASIKLEQNQFESADSIAYNAELKFDSTDIIGLYHITELRVILNRKAKKIKVARELMAKALEYAQKENSKSLLLNAYKIAREIEYEEGNIDSCFALSTKIEALKEKIYNENVAIKTQKIISEFELQLKTKEIENNKIKSTLAALELKNKSLRNEKLKQENELISKNLDQVNLQKHFLEQQSIAQQKELEQEQKNNELLHYKNELYQRTSQYEKTVILLMIIGLVISFSLILMYRKNLLNEKKINRLLEEQKQLLNSNIYEINHRIKNNLQLINSVLNFQSRKIQDPVSKELIENTKNRILSVAMVHNQLSYNDNISSVNCRNFIASLFENIIAQFELSTSQIELSVSNDVACEIDASKAIITGMIINELMTNYVKYVLKYPSKYLNIEVEKLSENKIGVFFYDNGEDFNPLKMPENSNGIGLKLIKLYAEQTGVTMSYSRTNRNKLSIVFQ